MTLEHKVPPPIVALLVGVLMWGVSALPPALPLPSRAREGIAGALALVGLAFDVLGFVAFLRSRTTVNPLRPDRAATLVTGGVYRITRNPMYVGLALVLTAWAVLLASPWPFLGPVAFVAYITRFQIAAEERALREKFGEFPAYASRVRRWL